MRSTPFWVSLGILLLSSTAFGVTPIRTPSGGEAACKEDFFQPNDVKVQILYGPASKRCLLSVGFAGDEKGAGNRTFNFQDDGQLLAFSALKSENGARVFYLFPRRGGVPTYEISPDESITVRVPSGDFWRFSGTTGRPLSFSGGEFKEAKKVSMKNQGGFEIPKYKGLLLDCGWKMGDAPITDSKRSCIFRAPSGETCSVPNSELFTYFGYQKRDAVLTFQDDKQLSDFLKIRCPKLDTMLLVPPGTTGVVQDLINKKIQFFPRKADTPKERECHYDYSIRFVFGAGSGVLCSRGLRARVSFSPARRIL